MRWLDEKRPVDILCLQETKCASDQFPVSPFQERGYHLAINGQKRLNGVAICSKLPLENIVTHFDHEILDAEKRLVQADIGETTILNCYIPRGGEEGQERHAFKMAFFDALRAYVVALLAYKERVLLLGDFNVALESIDVYDTAVFEGAVGFLPSERDKMRTLLNAGLHDCFRHAHPDQKAFTWWDYRTAAIWRDEGMRIDYILASDALCPLLEKIEVDLWTRRRRSPTPSDHAPLVASFKNL